MKRYMVFVIIFSLSSLLYVTDSFAGYQSCGTNCFQPDTCSASDVQSAVDAATDGDTIILPAGNATYDGTHYVSISNKGLKIVGAGSDGSGTNITDVETSTAINKAPFYVDLRNVTSETTFEISDIRFDGEAGAYGTIHVRGETSGNEYCNVNIHDCVFYILGEDGNDGYAERDICIASAYGVIYNNIFDATGLNTGTYKAINVWGSNNLEYTANTGLGSSRFLFIEDNTFIYQARNDGAIDSYQGARWVFRNNTVYGTNVGSHGCDSSNSRGTRAVEVYNNTFDRSGNTYPVIDGNTIRALNFRSGVMYVWGNRYIGSYKYSTESLNLYYYRKDPSFSFSGPCAGQCDNTPEQYDFGGGSVNIDGQSNSYGYICRDQPGAGKNDSDGSNQVMEGCYEYDNLLDSDSNGSYETDCYWSFGPSGFTDVMTENTDFFNDTQKPNYTPYTYPHPLRTTSTVSGTIKDWQGDLFSSANAYVFAYDITSDNLQVEPLASEDSTTSSNGAFTLNCDDNEIKLILFMYYGTYKGQTKISGGYVATPN